MMIAEGEYPDFIYAKGSATDLYEAGAFIDMRPLIEEYGPNIKEAITTRSEGECHQAKRAYNIFQ